VSGDGPRSGPSAWRVVATICRDDLLHIVRDRTALIFMIALPVIVMVIIGATIGAAPSAVAVGFVDLDGSPASARVRDALDRTGALSVEVYADETGLRRDVRTQLVTGGVIIPAGFGERIEQDGAAAVVLEIDPTQPAGQALATVVDAAVAREGAVLAASRFALEQGRDPTAAPGTARELADTVPAVPVQVEVAGEASSRVVENRYAYTAPSNLVLFVFVSTLAAGTAVIERRQLGVTRRMLAAPVTARSVIAGTAAARLLVAVLQSATILAIGAIVFGVDWGHPLGAALVVVTFAALATGVSLVVGALATNPDTAQSVGVPVGIGLGMLGGTMWPLEIVPAPMQVIGHLTPHAWAMDAWTKLIFEDAGPADIALDVAVLAGLAVIAAVVASWALRRSLLNP
jgi:ABC-2 type transport system permease protein